MRVSPNPQRIARESKVAADRANRALVCSCGWTGAYIEHHNSEAYGPVAREGCEVTYRHPEDERERAVRKVWTGSEWVQVGSGTSRGGSAAKPGDVVGDRFVITRGPVAIQGLPGCMDMACTRWVDRETGEDRGCFGYHCPDCLERTGMTGHKCPKRGEA